MTSKAADRAVERYRTTIYLEEEDLIAIDDLRAHFRRRERRRVDKSQLIREALRAFREINLSPADGERIAK